MRYITSLIMMLIGAVTLTAQNVNTLVFVNASNETVGNDVTITVNTPQTDDFGELMLPAGLSVKNISAADQGARIICNVQTLDNGSFQLCFPLNCITKVATEMFQTSADIMTAGETRPLQTEWLPTTYGTCTATYQIQLMTPNGDFPPKFEAGEMGPMVTVNYVYADPASVNEVDTDSQTTVVEQYNVAGARVNGSQPGLRIQRMSNGKTRKTMK